MVNFVDPEPEDREVFRLVIFPSVRARTDWSVVLRLGEDKTDDQYKVFVDRDGRLVPVTEIPDMWIRDLLAKDKDALEKIVGKIVKALVDLGLD